MKQITYNKFGGTEVLQMTEVPMPAGEIIVKVKAASINPLDWKLFQGEMTLMSGKKFPKAVGIDFAGVVEQGNGQYKKGDEVFGIASIFKGGALAEYVAVKATDIARKPANISFEAAAALPVGAGAALQIIEQLVKVKKGDEVLINGAGGGIGSFAIQLAKKAGAVVTSVVGPSAVEMADNLGSDIVIDYKKVDVLNNNKQYDAVIDLSGKITYGAAKPILKKKGMYVNTSPGPKQMLGSLFAGSRYKLLFLKPVVSEYEKLVGLKVLISKRYSFGEYKKAYDEVMQRGVVGKAVIVF